MPSLKKSEGKKITDDFVRLLFLLGSKSYAAELLSSMVPLEGSRSGRYGTGESSVYSWKEGTLV
jgi:hypothetical protein